MSRLVAAYLAALAILVGLAVTGGVLLYRHTGPDDPIEAAADANAFNIVSWEVRHFPEKWLYKIGHLFDGRSEAEEDEVISRYFTLAREIDELERDPEANAATLESARRERTDIENEVEDILEGRVTSVLEDQRLVMNPPLFSDLDVVFPPVDFELDSPPRVLAISPRDTINLDRNYLLSPGLDLAGVIAIEEQSEGADIDEHGVSAVVLTTGGVATYPSVVDELDSYHSLIDIVFHEWIHQYLAFFPLGRSYFSGSELRTLNETVAGIAGRELAHVFRDRYGSPQLPPSPPSPAADEGFDFWSEMRALRLRVEELLTEGNIEEAEALMRNKRDEFEGHGVFVRRINQAYFAFRGFYADSPGSIDPIGPKMRNLFDRSRSPGEFVRIVSQITSADDLDRLLGEG
jgi:hypothetical protein